MPGSVLKSSLKLQRKVLYELKLASKLITERERRQELELKIKAIDKLLAKAEEKTTHLPVKETANDFSQRPQKEQLRLDKISTEPEHSPRSESYATIVERPQKPYGPPGPDAEPPIFQGHAFEDESNPTFWNRAAMILAGWAEKIKHLFRRNTSTSLSDAPLRDRKPKIKS